MPKRRRYYRRPGHHKAKWRPLGKLTEDHLFIISIVTVLPGVGLKVLRDIYVADCELVGKKPLRQRAFLKRIECLLGLALIRKGIPSIGETLTAFYPGPLLPGRSVRRICLKKPVYWF